MGKTKMFGVLFFINLNWTNDRSILFSKNCLYLIGKQLFNFKYAEK